MGMAFFFCLRESGSRRLFLTSPTGFAKMWDSNTGNIINFYKGKEEKMSENKEEIKTEISADNTASEYEVINIPISDGTEREFAIMDTFEVEGQNYMAVSLIEGDEIQEGVYIYRYQNAEDGDVIVEKITSPAEYKKVSKAYEQM